MIDILLACFNGEKYITEQIDSILNQSYQNWNLIIRDDGSKDRTLEIVKEYIDMYPSKIHLIESTVPSGSAKMNFFQLMQVSTQSYVMFCDQDDIWFSDKVQITLEKMIQTEYEYPDLPILVHSDLEVVDEKGRKIADSLYHYQSIDVSYFNRIERMLVQNTVTGCTMMINRSMLNLVASMPSQAIMHDWWIALFAISHGHIEYINEPTIYYRQHERNEVGAKNTKSFSYWLMQLNRIGVLHNQLQKTYDQALVFSEFVSGRKQTIVNDYASLANKHKLRRIFKLIRGGYLKNTWIRRLGQLFLS